MSALPYQLMKLIPLLASDQDGEALAARNAISRLLRGSGHDWHDFAKAACRPEMTQHRVSPPSPGPWGFHGSFHCRAKYCRDNEDRLTTRENEFVTNMCRIGVLGRPTEAQKAWLEAIYARLTRGAAAA